MLSSEAQALFVFLSEKDRREKEESVKPKVSLKTSVGFFAFVYEKARNFIDYQEEHLLLRRAITRILVRRIKSNSDPKQLVESLVSELLMARYLENGQLPEEKLPQAQKVLQKFLLLYKNLGQRKLENGESLLDFLLSLTAREIEEIFVPTLEDQLLNFALEKLKMGIVWEDKENGLNEEEKRIKLLVALMRTLAKYDDRTVYFKLFKLYFPKWTKAEENEVLLTTQKFSEADSAIRRFLTDPQGERLARILRKQIAPFQILRDLISRGWLEVQKIFSSEEELAKAALAAADFRYQRAISSLRRSAGNSFVYIFITKMLFAFAIEVPYEMYITSRINYLPIVINLFLPPSLMLFMALTVESPTQENTKKIVEEILAMTFRTNSLGQIKIELNKKKSLVLTTFFRILYGLAFLIAFGGTVYLLRKLQFTVVSLGVFFFFLSTISFFAFRIRSSFKELVVGEEGSNLVSILFDFFMLPFIKLGRVVSSGLQEINIFVFIFDIIIEAPFKFILEIIEEWVSFLKEKKEEALNVIK